MRNGKRAICNYQIDFNLDRTLCLIYLQALKQQPLQKLPVSNSRKKDINNKEGCIGRVGQKAQLPEDSFNHVELFCNSSES